tara:strand:+ start:160 stop:999 length:840 start_codon:yes stop_codon:yes gene_type:complete
MAYIGREPQIGNFQVCDAISVVNGQAAYTMQVSSVNVSPESANHMLVSLNGILQKAGSSFTVSSSTITFASNLVTGDVIDFIHILGSVLDLGVPSDSTVSLAKLTATGTKDSTTFLRGDNTFNAPPNTGITEADQWRLSSSFSGGSGTINAAWERNDTFYDKIGTGMSESSGVFTFPSTGIWRVFFGASMIPNASSNYSGFKMQGSQNSGSAYSTLTQAWTWTDNNARTLSACGEAIFDVNNASNCRFRFSASATTTVVFQGETSNNTTYATFIRLGDT